MADGILKTERRVLLLPLKLGITNATSKYKSLNRDKYHFIAHLIFIFIKDELKQT